MTDAGVVQLAHPPRRSTWLERVLRERVLDLLRGLQDCALLVREGGESVALVASSSAPRPAPRLRARRCGRACAFTIQTSIVAPP